MSHAGRIEDAVLVGMGAIVLDGAVVKKHAFIGAGALVPPGRTVGEGELWVGNPARKMRVLSDAEIEGLHYSAGHYVRLKDEYLAAGTPRSEEHTSELQSLMRISYAVFCLKK